MNRHRLAVVIALLLLLATAAAVRLYRFGSFPPGLHYDEAAHMVAAREMLETGRPQVFFPINFGLEPGYIYLIAALFAFTGPFAEGGRVVSLILGLAAVPLAYLLAKELLRGYCSGPWATVAGMIAAAQTVFTYWYINFSRTGYEHMLLVVLSMLAFWALWRASRREGLPGYALAGFLLGLCLYTYPSARFLPLVPAAQGVALLLRRRGQALRCWRFGAVYVGAAFLAALPLFAFIATHPDLYFMRASQVTGFSLPVLLDNTVKTIGGIFWRGDTNTRYNLSGRPLLDAVQFLLLLAGMTAIIRRLRPAGAFLAIWLGVMLLPGALSDLPPQFGRLCGILPPLVLLLSLGATAFVEGLWQGNRVFAGLAITLALIFTAASSLRHYFLIWPQAGDWTTTFDTGIRRAAEIARDLPAAEAIYFTPVSNDHLTVVFVAGGQRAREIRSFRGQSCLVFPERAGRGAHYLILANEEGCSLPALQALFPGGDTAVQSRLRGEPYLVRFDVPAGALPEGESERNLQYDFAGLIRLGDFDYERRPYHPGERMAFRVAWLSLAPADRDYTAFIHLVGSYNRSSGNPLWGQDDGQPCQRTYPTSRWTPGEWVVEERGLFVDSKAPAGEYQVHVGWYDLATGRRLLLPSGANHVVVAKVRVE